MTKTKPFHQRLLDGDAMGVGPVERLRRNQADREARKAAQSKRLELEAKRRKDAPEEPKPAFWKRLMEHAGVKPPADSFKQRLLDTLEGK